MSYLPLRAHPTTLPLLLAASLDLFVTVLVPVEAEAQYFDLRFRWQFSVYTKEFQKVAS